MPDIFTETSRETWAGSVLKSLVGLLFGAALVIGAVILLTWNEGRTIHRTRALEEIAVTVISVPSKKVSPSNEGKPVHVTGRADTKVILKDPLFGIACNALKLERHVEVFQWKEEAHSRTEKKMGGTSEKTTTYEYTKEWAPERIASSRFKHRSGHENPASWKVAPWSRNADSVSVGAFRLPARLLKELPATELLSVSESLLSSLPLSLRNHIRLTSPSELYLGNNPIQPEVGDERIVFRVLYPTEVSIVARQARGSFEPFNARSRSAVELIELGELDAASMIDRANQKNRIIAWVLRGCGFFCCFIGIALGFAPLAMVADIIPLLGDVIRAGTTIAALALSAMVSLATIAIAWFAYRPWLSGSLLAIGLLLFFMIRKPSRRRARS